MPDKSIPNSFPTIFNSVVPVEPEGGRAYFGLDVLRGLTHGIDEFVALSQPRWRQFRSMGTALLGSAMWIDDPELLDRLGQLSNACVVVTKQARTRSKVRKLGRLEEFNEQTKGLSVRPFWNLRELMPKVDGEPAVVGPYSPIYEGRIPTIRTAGFRQNGGQAQLPPIVHAKLVLLGHIWWHDEDEYGLADIVSFTPKRLWISSANFTSSSRRSLEFGFWTEDRALVRAAEDFLVRLIGHSENLDPDADHLDPELGTVEYDDVAMAEAWAAMRADGDYDEDI